MDNHEYQEISENGANVAALKFGLMITSYLIIKYGAIPTFTEFLNNSNECQARIAVLIYCISFVVLFLSASCLFFKRSRSLYKQKRTPLQSDVLFYRKRIYRNWRYKLECAACLSMSLSSLVFVLFLFYVINLFW